MAEFFVQTANVCEEIAEKGARRVEHIISDETFLGVKKVLKNSMEKQIVNAICFFSITLCFCELNV